MKKRPLLLVFSCSTLAALPLLFAAPAPAPPACRQLARVDQLHGDRRVDNYYWLRRKDDPAVTAYLNAENAYTDAIMRPTEALQEALYKEIVGRIKQTDLTVPYREGGYFYYTRTEE